jgi:hypothetical protein
VSNLYFYQPHARNQGMLRAVLSREECDGLLSPASVTYVGNQFPSVSDGPRGADDFVVLKIGAEEASSEWRPGFYRCRANLLEWNEMLRKLGR